MLEPVGLRAAVLAVRRGQRHRPDRAVEMPEEQMTSAEQQVIGVLKEKDGAVPPETRRRSWPPRGTWRLASRSRHADSEYRRGLPRGAGLGRVVPALALTRTLAAVYGPGTVTFASYGAGARFLASLGGTSWTWEPGWPVHRLGGPAGTSCPDLVQDAADLV